MRKQGSTRRATIKASSSRVITVRDLTILPHITFAYVEKILNLHQFHLDLNKCPKDSNTNRNNTCILCVVSVDDHKAVSSVYTSKFCNHLTITLLP